MAELSCLEKCGLGSDDFELEMLKKKLDAVEISKGSLQTQLSDMVRQHQTDQDEISSLLSKNSRIVTECDGLAVTVKTQNGNLADARKAMEDLNTKHEEVVKLLVEEKGDLKRELAKTQAT